MGKNLNLTKSLPFHLFWLQNINLLTKLTDILYWPCVYKTEHSTQTSRRLSFYRKWCGHIKLYVVSKFQKISFNYKLRRVCRFLQIQKAQIIVLKIPFAFTRSIPSAYGNFNTSRIKMEQFIFSV